MSQPSPTPWVFSQFSRYDGSPLQSAEDVAATVAHSARLSDRAELWGVTLPEDDENGRAKVVCYTGNGPRAAVNAAVIAHAVNCHADLLAALQSMAREILMLTEDHELSGMLVARLEGIAAIGDAAIKKAEGS